MSVIGRSTGRSAVACAAYRSGTELRDARYGAVHDYGPRRGIYETGIDAPSDAPAWVYERESLWNAVEAFERRKDAQLSREFVLAFPCQIDRDERRALLNDFIAKEIVARGLVADWAIHAPNKAGDERNWHAHIMTTMRTVGPAGFAAVKDRSLNAPEQLVHWREAWAELQNRTLARLGIHDLDGRPMAVDHRSLEAQGIERAPTLHLGPHATAMERNGKRTELGDANRAIADRNLAVEAVHRQAHRLIAVEARERLLSQSRDRRPSRGQRAYDFER